MSERTYEERKPVMSEARRKVLNLLEFILESQPEIQSVYNVFAIYAAKKDDARSLHRDHIWVKDEEWAEWLEDYADDLQEQERARHKKEEEE